MEEYEIKNVNIVPCSSLNPDWKTDMQVVCTNKGEFIDRSPINNGYDWRLEIGKIVMAEILKGKPKNRIIFHKSIGKAKIKTPMKPDIDIIQIVTVKSESSHTKGYYQFYSVDGKKTSFLAKKTGSKKNCKDLALYSTIKLMIYEYEVEKEGKISEWNWE